MDERAILEAAEAIAADALAGIGEETMLRRVCERIVAGGVRLFRVNIGYDILDPVLGGHAFEWRSAAAEVAVTQYDRVAQAAAETEWETSPFFRLYKTGNGELRRWLDGRHVDGEFPLLDRLKAEGATDYLALLCRFGEERAIGEMDGVYASFAGDRPGGFDDGELAAIRRLMPVLAAALKGEAMTRVAGSLVATYLGRDAGARVLRGQIERGRAETLRAAIWYSDLKGFTRIADTCPPEETIALLNDYADCVVTAVHGHGGQVLKFIGDGVLAVFDLDGGEEACARALDAVHHAQEQVAGLNARRSAEGRPTTDLYLSLHVGDVLYGNIGSRDRLDFTVVGPAVNEAARIGGMCRALDQDVVVSAAFAAAAGRHRDRLVSLGRYALRGVRRPQDLFTPEPADTSG